jgi:hypothetical protein
LRLRIFGALATEGEEKNREKIRIGPLERKF